MLRLVDRSDTLLATSLIAASIVLFHRPLRLVLDVAREVERQSHLDLVPALVILCFALAVHQARQRSAARAAASAAADDASRERQRAGTLESLVSFGCAVGRAQDLEELERALCREMPGLVGDRAFWVTLEGSPSAHLLAGPQVREVVADYEFEQLARRATQALDAAIGDADSVRVDEFQCFPLTVGREPVGMLGVHTGASELGPSDARRIRAGTSVLAVAVRNVRTIHETTLRSLSDSLTGCYNRAYAREALAQELRRARRQNLETSVILVDVDEFKTINDGHGHTGGDAVLVAIAGALRRTFRKTDSQCRYGGDEFLVVLPDTSLAEAEPLAERLRREIAGLPIAHGTQQIASTASVGVSVALPGELDVDAVIERADRAMYRAKQAGRNRAFTAPPVGAASLMRDFLSCFPPCETHVARSSASEPAGLAAVADTVPFPEPAEGEGS